MMFDPIKVLDKLLFSEPLIEKCTTCEAKILLVSHAIGMGFFYDKGANKRAKNFLIKYHIGCSLFILVCSAFYLNDLQVYDVKTVTFGVAPVVFTTIKLLIITAGSHSFDVFGRLVKFLVNEDFDLSYFTISLEKKNNGCIDVKKWAIVNLCNLLIAYFTASALFDLESQTKIIRFTKRLHLMKFFPIWCPFENWWAKKTMLFFQDALVFSEISIIFFTSLLIFVSIIQMHNKFIALYAKLKLSSERTFERIEIFDKQLEEAMQVSNERVSSSIIEGLQEVRKNTIEMFYRDFIGCVERYQHLHRLQLLLKNILDYCCSINYCFVLCGMIGFGFFGTEALSNIEHEFKFIIVMVIWFFACGSGWYMFCITGDLFSRQNGLFAKEVYTIPWYYFSPKQRKTVLTLFSIIQKPIYSRALKLKIVRKEAFPDFMNSVYSYLQALRTLNTKHRNS